jgi:hypothetical protein
MEADVRELRLPGGWMPEGRFGARNSVFYQAEELSPSAGVQYTSGRLYAGSRLAVWRPTRTGEILRLRVPIEVTSEYRIHFVARLDPNGGTVSLRLDGEPLPLATADTTIDLYRPFRTLLRDFALGPRELTAGTHTLEFVFIGAGEEVARPEVGLDFVWVQEER